MSSGAPAVSVVMAVRNPDPRYLREAVASVLAQTFTDLELIIVEDPSPVSVREILTGVADERLRIERNAERCGLPESLNRGIELARAPLIARFDADDLCLPRRLETQVAFLAKHPDIDVYGSRIVVIDEEGRPFARRLLPLTHEAIAATLRRFNCLSHPSVMLRKEALRRVGGYTPGIAGEDYDLWCRMLDAGARFANAADELVAYRFHPGSSKFEEIRRVILLTIDIKRRYFATRFTMVDRLRLTAERMLLLFPPAVVLWLFRKLQYKPIR